VERNDSGRKIISDMASFLKDRTSAESTYGTHEQKLAMKMSPEVDFYSVRDAWEAIRSLTEKSSGTHIESSTVAKNDVVTTLTSWKDVAKGKQKSLFSAGDKLHKELGSSLKNVDKRKQDYDKACKKAEQLDSDLRNAQSQPNIPVEKIQKMTLKAETAKKDQDFAESAYQQAVQSHNSFVISFEQQRGALLEQLQLMEDERLSLLAESLNRWIAIEEQRAQEIKDHIASAKEVVSRISPPQDMQSWIQAHITNASHPPPVEFVPYGTNAAPAMAAPAAAGATAVAAAPRAGSNNAAPTSGGLMAKVLFPYQAQESNELTFAKDDIIRIVSQEDVGWWEGELNGFVGLFPSNYVAIMENAPAQQPAAAVAPVQAEPAAPVAAAAVAAEPVAAAAAAPTEGVFQKCSALYDYEGENDYELSIKEGEILTISSEMEGWYMGTNEQGASGLFPCNYVQIMN
jgi:hypothetical protein